MPVPNVQPKSFRRPGQLQSALNRNHLQVSNLQVDSFHSNPIYTRPLFLASVLYESGLGALWETADLQASNLYQALT